MISTFKFKNHKEKTVIKERYKELDNSSINEIKESFNTSFSKSNNKEIRLNGIIIFIKYDDIINPPVIMDVSHNFPYLKLHFEIEGDLKYVPNDESGIPITIEDGNYNFFYLPKANGTITLKSRIRKEVSILVTEKYLKKTFKRYFENNESSLRNSLENKVPYKMFSKSKVIPSDLLLIISNVVSCSYQKDIKQVYLESKIKEIFSYLFSEMDTEINKKSEHKLSDFEYNQIIKSEKILNKNIHKSFKINDLSILTGINEHKLKRDFKLVFKSPVFTYLTNLRMEKAKTMLLKNNIDISDVAVAVGYKNPQHFTVAFKKKFNYLPSELKKNQLNSNR
ncbi:AraC family transcriptional regulator [Polaribacter sp. Q13]|uniref:helix-turn-helix domain-containing protein n=1 Tax=Polaribacter sp. Q13 TaxID=2806551 RepID=UPI00193BEB7C|nr:AraC family transcriptional regulator [Polaribacter sp. Q13]QVY66354.1 helix-turn-helix transcriptional regulator [Polaribacter sp. Q13]